MLMWSFGCLSPSLLHGECRKAKDASTGDLTLVAETLRETAQRGWVLLRSTLDLYAHTTMRRCKQATYALLERSRFRGRSAAQQPVAAHVNRGSFDRKVVALDPRL